MNAYWQRGIGDDNADIGRLVDQVDGDQELDRTSGVSLVFSSETEGDAGA